ncbi:MAG: hypothetical protein COU69_00490 [Candidatus Pacebacteria bacterium CG10_big_fil_rev_8_21_14_0_10_56_10]|nr:MAG: hypothetical protein COU69_00490 [Candidatus Pacebacteria bacterium CG10_big_fil_rev_8_21_14_0_10_56_10]
MGSPTAGVTAWLEENIRQHCFPGAVVGVVDGDGRTWCRAAGRFRYDAGAPAVTQSTVYDTASLTKSVVTATLALQLIDGGSLRLDQPVVNLVPELTTRWRRDITIEHLLTQTAVWRLRMSRLKELSGQDILDRLLTAELTAAPGSTFGYSNAASVVLGLVIERAARSSLETLASRKIFGPLGMGSATLRPVGRQRRHIPPTELTEWRGLIQSQVHDESAWKLQQVLSPGSAGLFCSAPDLLKFAAMLLAGGKAADGNTTDHPSGTTSARRRVLSPSIVARLNRNWLPAAINDAAGLGWELGQAWMGRGADHRITDHRNVDHRNSGSQAANRRIGKTGFTGCCMVIDFECQLGLVMLSNATFPDRSISQGRKNRLRSQLCDMVFADC